MEKRTIKIIIILIIVLCSILLVFHRHLMSYYYEYEAVKLIKEKHDNIKIKRAEIGKTRSNIGYSYPICKIKYESKNNKYKAVVDIPNKQVYDNHQYKEIYNDLSSEIISTFGTKYKEFNLDYYSEIDFIRPESFAPDYGVFDYSQYLSDYYDGNNINKIITEGTMYIEFNTINTSLEEIKKFINKYNKFDINISLEKEMTIIDQKTNLKCSTKNIYTNYYDKKINIDDNCYKDINNIRVIGEKDGIEQIKANKINAFEFSNQDFFSNEYYYQDDFIKEYRNTFINSKYKVVSDFYKTEANDIKSTYKIQIKGNFNPNKKYLIVYKNYESEPNIKFEVPDEVTATEITYTCFTDKNEFAILEIEN